MDQLRQQTSVIQTHERLWLICETATPAADEQLNVKNELKLFL